MKQPVSIRRQAGGTFVGFLIGVVVGLAIAAIVAVVVTKAPIPFMTKGPARAADATPPGGGALPDPNKPLYGRDVKSPNAGVAPTPPAGEAGADADKKFSFYDVAPKPPKTDAVAPGTSASSAATGDTPYLLQAGAFKSTGEADAMRGRLALLGFDAKVSTVERSGETLYRVRIGPIAHADDANKARQLLSQNGIDAALIKAQP